VDVRVVTKYAKGKGAARAFAVVEDERGDPRTRDVPGTRLFGDQSELTHNREIGLDGTPYHDLNLTFRARNLVADVSVSDFTGAEQEVATAEALAETLRAKVEQAQAGWVPGRGPSWRLLRWCRIPSASTSTRRERKEGPANRSIGAKPRRLQHEDPPAL
jgi:hypothetical protein